MINSVAVAIALHLDDAFAITGRAKRRRASFDAQPPQDYDFAQLLWARLGNTARLVTLAISDGTRYGHLRGHGLFHTG